MITPPPPANSRKINGLIATLAILSVSGCLHNENTAASGVQITPPPAPPSTLTPAPSGNYAATAILRQPLQAWQAALADGTSLSISIATGADRAPSVLISIGQRGTSTIALGATATAPAIATAYTKPDFLLLNEIGGVTTSNANAGAILIYDLRHSKSGTIYTHYLGAEYAALALRYGGHHTPTMYRAGNLVPAAYSSTIAARYHIPVGAAYGHIKQHGANTNAVLVHNLTAGMLDVDFANDAVTLNLTLAAAGNSAIYGIADWRLALSPDGRTFGNHPCPSSGGAATSGCGGTVLVSDASSITVEVANDVRAPVGQDVDMFGGFYGNARQEFALAMHHILADYTFAGGVLGRDSGMTAPVPIPTDGYDATMTLRAASQTLFAAWAGGTTPSLNFVTDANGRVSEFVNAGTTINLGTPLALGAHTEYFVPKHPVDAAAAITLLTNGIDVEVIRRPGLPPLRGMYQTPSDFLLDEVGGATVASGASVTVKHAHHIFKSATSANTAYTHFLGAEYAALAMRYDLSASAAPTMFHGGVLAPAAFFATASLSSADYIISVGAAYGHYSVIDDTTGKPTLSVFLRNEVLDIGSDGGTLRVDFANGVVTVAHITLKSHLSPGHLIALENWGMTLSANGRRFGSSHCPSAGGTASGCGGRFHSSAGSFFQAITNSVAIPVGVTVDVFGAFYGNEAQEFALAFRYLSGNHAFNGGILGRKANAGAGGTGASGASAPAGALAVFPRAEFAAFTSADAGGAKSITHTGSHAPRELLATMSAATYRIAAGKAGGVYTAANGAEMVLANTGAGDELRVDFASGAAVLDLSVGDSTGAHGYVLDDVGLELLAGGGFNFCTSCTGSVSGSGALSGFNAAAGLGIDGAFYGAGAQEAAAVLRHTAEGGAGVLEMGFVGVR